MSLKLKKIIIEIKQARALHWFFLLSQISFLISLSSCKKEVKKFDVIYEVNFPKGNAVSISYFYIIAIPVFTFTGLLISSSSLSKDDKFLITIKK